MDRSKSEGWELIFFLKTDSGYPKDEGVALFALATSGNPLRYNTHGKDYVRRPIPPLAARLLESNLQVWVIRKRKSSKADGGLTRLIPKLLLRLLWFFRRTAALFRQLRTFSQLFRFCSDLGNPGIRQNVRNSMLTGRWWEGRILINLCGKNNVRNCDLLQSNFFARSRTVLRRQRDFLACVVTLGKRWGPEPLWFFTLEKHATKSHLPKLIFPAGRSDIGGPKRVSAPSNAEMKLHGVSSTGRVLKFAYVFVHAVGGAAPLHSPHKPLRQRQPKTGSDG